MSLTAHLVRHSATRQQRSLWFRPQAVGWICLREEKCMIEVCTAWKSQTLETTKLPPHTKPHEIPILNLFSQVLSLEMDRAGEACNWGFWSSSRSDKPGRFGCSACDAAGAVWRPEGFSGGWRRGLLASYCRSIAMHLERSCSKSGEYEATVRLRYRNSPGGGPGCA